MLILSVALFGKSSYKNVVVNGLTLASDGKKMSKSLKNYPDPMVIMEKYSADALRYYLLSSSVVKGEDLSFSEVGVDEIMKKIIMRLDNVYSFYEMYTKNISAPVKNFMPTSTNILDLWIIARLNSLIADVTKFTDKYELDRAVRPIADFIDDLSTWYLRRSRDRFKLTSVGSVNNEGNKSEAVETTRFVLEELAKIIAPVMPFYAEELYQKVKSLSGLESVHLASWPEFKKPVNSDEQIIKDMLEVRRIVSLGLEARAKANIKVRQPLGSFRVLGSKFKVESPEKYFELIKDEVNVKDIFVVENITEEVELDTNITPELKEEGVVRDLTRAIQELRKQEKLSPRDTVSLIIKTNQVGQDIIKKFDAEIRGTTLLRNISLSESAPDAVVGEPSRGTLVVIDGINFELIIIR